MDRSQVRLCTEKSRVNLIQLQRLLEETAFWGKDRNLADLRTAITHSNPVISAWHGPRLVGFARATSDGVYRATIWDVVVHPEYQGSGLGRKLIAKTLRHPFVRRVERIYLMTTHHQAFYERLGFEVNTSTTMVSINNQVSPQQPVPEILPQPVPRKMNVAVG